MNKNIIYQKRLICGYIPKYRDLCILILGEHNNNTITFSNIVTYGVTMERIQSIPFTSTNTPLFPLPSSMMDICHWVLPHYECVIELIHNDSNNFRLPILRKICFT